MVDHSNEWQDYLMALRKIRLCIHKLRVAALDAEGAGGQNHASINRLIADGWEKRLED